ncbi:unnamed protein product [Clavelina lepadiformis]|uniref:Ubiquitin thioesterase OTU n=1 Tax=Clavelina lepadiformis TaxID=159417 RepID=A0ABP0H391_CLALP
MCYYNSRGRLTTKLYGNSTLHDLKKAIKAVSGIAEDFQKILSGYPPKPIDLSNTSATLDNLRVKSGDTFTIVNVEHKMSKPPVLEPSMIRKEVPADNSCLFYSVYFALNGYLSERDYSRAKKFRGDIANVVQSNPSKYTEAFLGKAPSEYSIWIQCDTSWGGGIELSILSEIYQIEIAAVDIQTLRVDNYGQDCDYKTRVFLLYDGIHYDPMFLDSGDKNLPIQTIFSVSDDLALAKALKIAEIAHSARQYTNVGNFKLQCLTCNTRLTGQKSAQQHAKETGHGNFGEIC